MLCWFDDGQETGKQRIRNEILNKDISDKEIFEAYQICKKTDFLFR